MNARRELFQYLNAYIEQPSEFDATPLNTLLRERPDLIDDYIDFLSIHGQLHWQAGHPVSHSGASHSRASQQHSFATPSEENKRPVAVKKQTSGRTSSDKLKRQILTVGSLAAVVCVIGLVAAVISNPSQNDPAITGNQTPPTPVVDDEDSIPLDKIQLPRRSSSTNIVQTDPIDKSTDQLNSQTTSPSSTSTQFLATVPDGFTDEFVIAKIDSLLQQSWAENEIQPSDRALDSDWLRRAYLTYLGRIPTIEETTNYLNATEVRRDSQLIAQLTASSEAAEHQATVWSNLLVGRTARSAVNHNSLRQFLVDSFQSNQPWITTVQNLITAEGRNDQNGATNFLLAHLNNQATPATAVTARLFLGQQIACVQCHDHPFAQGLKQQDYWALNAFFKDTQRERIQQGGKTIHRLVDSRRPDRMTYFETRSGLTQAVLPEYDGHIIEKNNESHRRTELAVLLQNDSTFKVSKAMVNRTWAHFFGYGFTPQVDEIGPHVAISHPELFDFLAACFVKSNYNLKRLSTWVGRSDAWRRSSEFTANNETDQPEIGEVPLFSRVYLKRMTPEQVYDSVRVAIRSAADAPQDHSKDSLQHRRDWIQQFARSYNTDENDEDLNFSGSIGQAMVMMNGIDVDVAIQQATQKLLSNGPRPSSTETLNRLSLALLTRQPTRSEADAFKNRYRQLSRHAGSEALPAATEDMMWAYLNSSEFVIVR